MGHDVYCEVPATGGVSEHKINWLKALLVFSLRMTSLVLDSDSDDTRPQDLRNVKIESRDH